MSDTPVFGPDDRIDDLEALMRELDTDDFDLVTPPADVWIGIEDAIRSSGQVVPIGAARSRFSRRLLAAAAAIVVLAAGAVVTSALIGGDDQPVVASADLTYDAETFDAAGEGASATAELIERDGQFEIRIDDATLPNPGDEDLELWLIAVGDDGALDVQPVALVDSTAPGTYAVPAGLDPDVHSIVDISVEPRDGDEAHSGRSILRGALVDA